MYFSSRVSNVCIPKKTCLAFRGSGVWMQKRCVFSGRSAMTLGEVLDEAAKQAALEVGWALFRIFPSSLFKMYTADGLEIPFPTTWDVENPINNGIFTISTGAGFLPQYV